MPFLILLQFVTWACLGLTVVTLAAAEIIKPATILLDSASTGSAKKDIKDLTAV